MSINNIQRCLVAAAATASLTLASIRFADHPIADLLYSQRLQTLVWRGIDRISLPVTLLAIVLVLLGGTFALTSGPLRTRLRMLGIAASSLLLAYGVNLIVIKPIFGRTSPVPLWIFRRIDEFRFFSGGIGDSAFPSGHAAMICALMASLWLALPARRIWTVGLAVLACSGLIILEVHYLSDVLAGAFVGVAAAHIVSGAVEKARPDR